MPFVLVGVNHKTCPLDIREKFFLQPTEKECLLATLKADARVVAAFVLSTCNRTEIYADLLTAEPQAVFEALGAVKHIPSDTLKDKYFYVHTGNDVVKHLMYVVTGLDSLVLGEKQILGQVKEAIETARQREMLNRSFNLLAAAAVETGKKARRETRIDCGGSSVAWAAVTRAQQILGGLEQKTVLILGCGKMGALAVQQLRQKGVGRIYLMNRTEDKSVEMARRFNGQAAGFWQIRDVLADTDVCICSTGAPHYLVERTLMESVMTVRRNRPLVMADISVPRNIEPEAGEVPGVSLVAIDDLAQTVQDNMLRRCAAVADVRGIIDVKIAEFYKTLDKASLFELLQSAGSGRKVGLE